MNSSPSQAWIGDDQTRCAMIALASARSVGPASIARLRQESERRAVPLSCIVSRPAAELHRLGASAVAAGCIAEIDRPIQIGCDIRRRLAARGIAAVFFGEPKYPERISSRLGIHAPQVLFVLGDASLMRTPGIAVVGSRRPSRVCADAARRLTRELAAHYTVISGGARGIDTLAHQSAVETGATLVCPPVGILRFTAPVRPGRSRCGIVGQFPPSAGWQNAQALMRNRTIVALADAVFAFDPRDRGGTWHSCRQAVALGIPLFVASECATPELTRGVSRLVAMGATRLEPTAMPEPGAVSALICSAGRQVRPTQTALFSVPAVLERPSA